MIKIKRSDGKTFNFDDLYKLTKLDGVGEVSQQIFTESKAIGDGDIITGTRLGGRTIKIEGVCNSRDLNGIARGVATQFFNPKMTYKLTLNYKGSDVYCDVVIDSVALPTVNTYALQKIYLSFYSASPYYKSTDEFGKNIAAVYGAMGYPKVFPSTGFVNSYYAYGQTVFIKNDGDVATYCKAVINAKGEVVNFSFKNGTEYVRILDTMVKGDIYVVDFTEQTITKNGVNAIRLIDRSSTWWDIERGGADIGFTADSGSTAVNVTVYYNKLYSEV